MQLHVTGSIDFEESASTSDNLLFLGFHGYSNDESEMIRIINAIYGINCCDGNAPTATPQPTALPATPLPLTPLPHINPTTPTTPATRTICRSAAPTNAPTSAATTGTRTAARSASAATRAQQSAIAL